MSRSLVPLTTPLMLLLCTPAQADQPPPLSLADDFVVFTPPQTTPAPRFVKAEDSPWQVVYLNFDGGKLEAGGNNSQTNRTDLITVPTLDYPAQSWTAMGGRDKGIKDVVDALKLLFMNYAVKFVTERPTDGDYTMAMVGGMGESCKKGSAGTVGISPLDCTNAEKNDVVLIFGGLMNNEAQKLAYVIAHELGHSFGLEHVSDTKGIMYPALNPEVCCWVNSGLSEGSTCGRTSQDADAVLTDNVGVGRQDTQAPLVWFKRPGEGAVLPPDFSFEVTAGDDLGVHHVVVSLDGAKVLELSEPPYTAALDNIADGEHHLKAEVHDWAGQTGSVEVTFQVAADCVEQGTCYPGAPGMGGECHGGSECASGICATADGAQSGRCVQGCDASAEVSICPGDHSCSAASGGDACLPEGDASSWSLDGSGGDGGCSVSQRPARLLTLPLWLLLGLLVLCRRRA